MINCNKRPGPSIRCWRRKKYPSFLIWNLNFFGLLFGGKYVLCLHENPVKETFSWSWYSWKFIENCFHLVCLSKEHQKSRRFALPVLLHQLIVDLFCKLAFFSREFSISTNCVWTHCCFVPVTKADKWLRGGEAFEWTPQNNVHKVSSVGVELESMKTFSTKNFGCEICFSTAWTKKR